MSRGCGPAAGRRSDGWIGGHLTGPGQQAGPWVSRRRPLRLRAARRRRRFRGCRPGGPGGAARPGPPGRVRAPAARSSAARRRGTGRLAARHARRRAWTAQPGRQDRPSRLSARACRGSGGPATAAVGAPVARWVPAARSPRPRMRSRAFRGGPSALTAAGRGGAGPDRLAAAAPQAPGTGCVGGGVLGSRSPGSLGGGRGVPGAAFAARRSPGGPGGAAARPRPRRRSPVPEQRPRPAALGRPPAARAPGIPDGRAFPGGALAARPARGPGGRRRGFGRRRSFGAGTAQRIPVAGALA